MAVKSMLLETPFLDELHNFFIIIFKFILTPTFEIQIFHADVGFRVGFLLEKRKFFYANCGVWCGCCVGESPFRFVLSRAHPSHF